MNEPVKLWGHQQEIVDKARYLPYHLIAAGVGTGKTAVAIRLIMERCMEQKRLLRTLIVMPPSILGQWQSEEFPKFSNIPANCIHVLIGHNAKRVKMIEDFGGTKQDRKGAIFLINYEGLVMPNVFDAIMKWNPEILVLDECHRVRNHSEKRTKNIPKRADKATYKYLMSGTPCLNSIADFYSQVRILDGGKALTNNFFCFRARFMQDKNSGFKNSQRYYPEWTEQPGARKMIQELIAPFTSVVRKEDCLTLPPLVVMNRYVEMGEEQKRVYTELKEDFLSFLDSGSEIVATTALTRLLRLLQVASGFAKSFDGNETEFENNAKAEVTRDLLEEISPEHKTIIWCSFRVNYKTIRDICTELKIGYVEIHGEIPISARNEVVDRFNNDPTVRVLIANGKSAGEGLQLTVSSYSIFYSRNYSLLDYLQACGRNHRAGSEIHKKITHIHLITRGTVDEEVCKALEKKEDIGKSILSKIRGML